MANLQTGSIYQNFDDSSWPSNWFGCAPGSWTWPGFGDGDGDGSGKGGVTETGMTAYAIALTPGSGGSATASILSPLHIAVSVTSTATGALANLLGDVNTAITGEGFKLNIGDFSLPSYYYGTATIDGVSGFIANTLPGGAGLWYFVTPSSSHSNSLGRGASGTAHHDTTGASSPYQWDLATGQAVCFMAGTLIETHDGEKPVESLRPGDLIRCADGRLMPLRWLGEQQIVRAFADPIRVGPVRIRAGALGNGLPRRDLRCSPDHAFLLGGVLVQAGAMVNGGSIQREAQMPERFTYYHLELAEHTLVLAEGAASESFVDHIDRLAFNNWAARGPQAAMSPIQEMNLPRVKSARQLPAALRQALGQAQAA